MDRIVWYEHHSESVAVRYDLKGKHREHCLCYGCGAFKGGSDSEEGCPIAKAVFELCVERDLVLPVWECPAFKALPQGDQQR